MNKHNKKQIKNIRIGFIILGLVLLTIVTLGGIAFSKILTNKRYEGNIVSFNFSSSSGWDYGGYTIDNTGDKVVFRYSGLDGGKNKNVTRTISGEYLDRIGEILEKYDVASWDGFDESDDGILDGGGFLLKVKYTSGATIEAQGYMKYPDNYDAVRGELSEVFDEIME